MQATLKKFSPYEKFVITILALTQFTVVLDFMVMSPLGDMLMKSMNLSTAQFGFAVSSYAFSAGISGLLTAGFADKFDRKKLLIFFILRLYSRYFHLQHYHFLPDAYRCPHNYRVIRWGHRFCVYGNSC